MIPNIYISIPVTVDWAEVDKVSNKINSTGIRTNIKAWNRGMKYDNTFVPNCDIFMFMTPNNNWEMNMNINTLPSGVYRELTLAIHHNKPIFMVYKNREGIYNIYCFRKSNNTIGGEAGTSAVIWDKLKELSGKTIDCFDAPSVSDNTVHFDPRLLL